MGVWEWGLLTRDAPPPTFPRMLVGRTESEHCSRVMEGHIAMILDGSKDFCKCWRLLNSAEIYILNKKLSVT